MAARGEIGIGERFVHESISQVGRDPSDPFPQGYVLSDSWMHISTPSTAASATY